MLFKGSKIKIIDNSGINIVKVINFVGKNKIFGSIGNIVNIIAFKIKIQKKIVKKKLYFGLILNTKFWKNRSNGFFFKYDYNGIVLLNNNFDLIGTRILKKLGSYELKKYCFSNYNTQLRYEKILLFIRNLV